MKKIGAAFRRMAATAVTGGLLMSATSAAAQDTGRNYSRPLRGVA